MNVCLHMYVHCSMTMDATLFIFMLFVIVMPILIGYMELILVALA